MKQLPRPYGAVRRLPQQVVAPAASSAHVWPKGDELIATKTPAGGVLWPRWSAPQQAMVPSVLRPQGELIAVKVPDGNARSAEPFPQQVMVPSLLSPQGL